MPLLASISPAPRSRGALLCTLLLTLTLTACGGGPSAPTTPDTPTNGQTPVPAQVKITGQVILPVGALNPAALDFAAGRAAAWDAPHVSGELLVSAAGSTLAAQTLTAALAGLQTESLGELGLVRVWTSQPHALAQQLAESGITSQPNYLYTAQATPNDPGFPGREGVAIAGSGRAYQNYLTQIAASEAWAQLEAQGQTPAGVLTAVLDTGVDRSHPDLAERIAGGFDFCSTIVGNDCTGTDSDYGEILTQPKGHGTAMTGMIGAATNNGTGLSGVTWSGPLLAVKVLADVEGEATASATTVSLAAGLDYAVSSGARVINMSLGIPGLDNDPAVSAQLQRAAVADTVLVASAGNVADRGLFFPANRPEVLAVGAVNSAGQMSCFSARPLAGQTLTLLAPGGELGCGRPTSLLLELTRGGYQLGAGTSEAAALTSGAASLLRAAYPTLSAAQIRQALTQGGQPTDSAQPQLNVAGALAVAKTLAGGTAPVPQPPVAPQPQPLTYNLTVQAYKNGQPVGEAFSQTAQPLTSLRLPYALNLPQGQYELRASVVTSKASYSGLAAVNAAADTTQDIQLQVR